MASSILMITLGGKDVQLDWNDTQLYIKIAGYGECAARNGEGFPIMLEIDPDYDPDPVLRVWSDITDEDPTHKISLQQAAEWRREE